MKKRCREKGSSWDPAVAERGFKVRRHDFPRVGGKPEIPIGYLDIIFDRLSA